MIPILAIVDLTATVQGVWNMGDRQRSCLQSRAPLPVALATVAEAD